MTEHPPRRLRWYQFSVRTLFGLVLLLSIGLSWLGAKMHGARQQRQAVAAIEALGGRVYYERVFDADPDLSSPPLRDWFYGVSRVDLSKTGVSDEALSHLKAVSRLQDLNLSDTRITDAGLEHLKGLRSLESLYLNDTRITDAGVGHLTGMTTLQYLSLEGTDISDAALQHLKGMTRLRHLNLDATHITGAALEHLKGMSGLEFLSLARTQVDDAARADLQKALPHCRIAR